MKNFEITKGIKNIENIKTRGLVADLVGGLRAAYKKDFVSWSTQPPQDFIDVIKGHAKELDVSLDSLIIIPSQVDDDGHEEAGHIEVELLGCTLYLSGPAPHIAFPERSLSVSVEQKEMERVWLLCWGSNGDYWYTLDTREHIEGAVYEDMGKHSKEVSKGLKLLGSFETREEAERALSDLVCRVERDKIRDAARDQAPPRIAWVLDVLDPLLFGHRLIHEPVEGIDGILTDEMFSPVKWGWDSPNHDSILIWRDGPLLFSEAIGIQKDGTGYFCGEQEAENFLHDKVQELLAMRPFEEWLEQSSYRESILRVASHLARKKIQIVEDEPMPEMPWAEDFDEELYSLSMSVCGKIKDPVSLLKRMVKTTLSSMGAPKQKERVMALCFATDGDAKEGYGLKFYDPEEELESAKVFKVEAMISPDGKIEFLET